jgi:hypothetical protein
VLEMVEMPTTISSMQTLRARVRNGRLVMDEPTDLEEGTELELAIAGDADELDEEERARLHSALRRSWASAKAGKTRPAGRLLRKLKGA